MARAKAKAVHMANIVDYQLFDAVKRETRDFILAVVDDKWVLEFHESINFYTAVVLSEPLDHLKK